jgi:hypothetical protein
VVHPVGSPDAVLPNVSLGWLAGVLGLVLVGSLVFMRYTWGRFFDLSGDFAEEL